MMVNTVEYPKLRDIFGRLMFDRKVIKEKLNSEVYERLTAAMEGRNKLDAALADTVAMAMRDWALSNGATHWAHWFHPLTELTAEKHLAFTLPSPDGSPIDVFRGKDLIQGEPDASSFPSAGRRSTFEARGYSAWDSSSPAFIIKSAKGGTLCIPSVFLSYDGTPLDLKTPLLRALSAIEERSLKLLKMFGQRGVRSVRVTVGAEQEYFLLDRPRAQQRPDIRYCGRTLLGAPPAKDQKLDHHYMGAIPQRVLAYMDDVGRDLAELGVPIMTRHNEVARCQFEFAPLFSDANTACDQNQIVMETMRKLAQKHDLRLLFHEKPFAGMNGSGKHINISLMDNEGRNLLKATNNHRRNVIFLTFLSALVLGVSEYHSLLQAGVATAGNMFRLGGHEAPPSIMSVYLGQTLTDLLSRLDKSDLKLPDKEMLDIGLAKLPALTPYDCDRNRTSPIAFTGDKFEFRAPGSSQSIALPVTLFASIWAWGLERLTEMIEARTAQGAEPIDVALDAVKEAIKRGSRVLFEGDAYSREWHEDARHRGLIQAESTPEKIDLFLLPKNMEILEHLGVFKEPELKMLHEVRMDSFERALEIELSILYDMLWEGVLPAISKQLVLEKKSLSALDGMDFPEGAPWKKYIRDLGVFKASLIADAEKLAELKERLTTLNSRGRAELLVKEAVPLMEAIRAKSDAAELLISADIWPYPIYRSLLSLSV
ncbi:MAG: glutamine synthetase III [Synergistaceae bacterium]|jgi:glutamine synthetase|nr:glutamine synthetase III [Synergistaceae bacterium]